MGEGDPYLCKYSLEDVLGHCVADHFAEVFGFEVVGYSGGVYALEPEHFVQVESSAAAGDPDAVWPGFGDARGGAVHEVAPLGAGIHIGAVCVGEWVVSACSDLCQDGLDVGTGCALSFWGEVRIRGCAGGGVKKVVNWAVTSGSWESKWPGFLVGTDANEVNARAVLGDLVIGSVKSAVIDVVVASVLDVP